MKATNKTISQPKSRPDPVPLGPINQATPFEIAALAVLLSKGQDPAKCLGAATSIWMQAYDQIEQLRLLFWGDEAKKIPATAVFSFGPCDHWMSVKEACAKYACGQEHLRDLLKETLPPHLFEHFWKRPIASILLLRTLLVRIEKVRADRRRMRSQKNVKSD